MAARGIRYAIVQKAEMGGLALPRRDRARRADCRRSASVFSLMVLALLLSAPQSPQCAGDEAGGDLFEEPRQWSLAIRWENDTFNGTDRFYTNGVSLWLAHTGKSWLDAVADRLPWGSGRRTVAYEAVHLMMTPADTSRRIPDRHDRPYAGILYMGLSLHVEDEDRYHGLKLVGGMVGPWSEAEEVQREVHRQVGSGRPRGWDYQLHNEPVLDLVYEHRRKYRLWDGSWGLGIEALPVGSLMLGNLLTQAQIGGQLRVGYSLPADFGTTLMRGMDYLPSPRPAAGCSRPRWGVFVYGGANANLVLHDISLDGNTWKHSRRVDREWLVPAAETGLVVVTARLSAAFSYVVWGREFRGQPENSAFGAFTVSYRF
jgi:lipid A 3-O-deacylase